MPNTSLSGVLLFNMRNSPVSKLSATMGGIFLCVSANRRTSSACDEAAATAYSGASALAVPTGEYDGRNKYGNAINAITTPMENNPTSVQSNKECFISSGRHRRTANARHIKISHLQGY